MISNMESQLKQQGAATASRKCWPRCRNVRKDAGYPPLVTPSSQIVGTQAVFNVLMGRYKVLTGEFADLMLGYYGETIGPRDPRGHRSWQPSTPRKQPITCRPADLLKPEWEELARRRRWHWTAATAPTRTCSPTPCSRRWRRSFFRTRDAGPEEPGQGSRSAAGRGCTARRARGQRQRPGARPRSPTT